MATYLKIQNGTKTKEYTLTNAYQKPYIRVSNSILPLTTRTTTGMHLKAQNGNTSYRPLEYVSTSQSASTSESTTYNTSNADGVGLSSTTALTRESTSKTVYDTRASTSNTIYGTAGDQKYKVTFASCLPPPNTHLSSTRYMTNVSRINGLSFYGNPIYITNSNYNGAVVYEQSTSIGFYYDGDPYSLATASYRTNIRTTGTTYQTRASTYQTRYLTRSSTSGYSGVSSSSSSASSSTSAMTWD